MSTTSLATAVGGAGEPKKNDHPTIVRIQAKADEFAKAMPSVMTKDRFMRIAIGAIRKNPKLLECDPLSLMGSLLVAAQLGFEVNTPLQHFFLIPRWNKNTGKMEADGQIGYKGWMELLHRSGRFVSITAESVHENDHFVYRLGDEPLIEHVPSIKDRGRAYAYYVSVRVKDGGIFRKVLHRDDVERYRRRSQSPNSGAWTNDFDSMALKTTFLRMTPWIPKSTEMQNAVAYENTVEAQGRVIYREKQNAIEYEIPEQQLPEIEQETHDDEPTQDAEYTDAEVVQTQSRTEEKPAAKAPRKRQPVQRPGPGEKMVVTHETVGPEIKAAPFDDQPAEDTRIRPRQPANSKPEPEKASPLGAAVKAIEAWAIEAVRKHEDEGLPDLADKSSLMDRIYDVQVRMGTVPEGVKGFFSQANALAKLAIQADQDPVAYLEEANEIVREEYLGVPDVADEPAQEQEKPSAKPKETAAEKMQALEKWFDEAAANMGERGHRSLVMPSALVAAVYAKAHKAGLIHGSGTANGYRTRLIEIAEITGSGHDVIQKMKPFCKQLLAELEAPEPGSDG